MPKGSATSQVHSPKPCKSNHVFSSVKEFWTISNTGNVVHVPQETPWTPWRGEPRDAGPVEQRPAVGEDHGTRNYCRNYCRNICYSYHACMVLCSVIIHCKKYCKHGIICYQYLLLSLLLLLLFWCLLLSLLLLLLRSFSCSCYCYCCCYYMLLLLFRSSYYHVHSIPINHIIIRTSCIARHDWHGMDFNERSWAPRPLSRFHSRQPPETQIAGKCNGSHRLPSCVVAEHFIFAARDQNSKIEDSFCQCLRIFGWRMAFNIRSY